jgi:hypothetical protein
VQLVAVAGMGSSLVRLEEPGMQLARDRMPLEPSGGGVGDVGLPDVEGTGVILAADVSIFLGRVDERRAVVERVGRAERHPDRVEDDLAEVASDGRSAHDPLHIKRVLVWFVCR